MPRADRGPRPRRRASVEAGGASASASWPRCGGRSTRSARRRAATRPGCGCRRCARRRRSPGRTGTATRQIPCRWTSTRRRRETAAEAPESTFGVRPAAPADLFEGIVQLEIGPLADFSQLVGFEDAAGAIGATSEISVTRFSAGRASLDLRLSEPVDLLRELGERSPFDFKVRSVRDGRLILDLGDEAEAARSARHTLAHDTSRLRPFQRDVSASVDSNEKGAIAEDGDRARGDAPRTSAS